MSYQMPVLLDAKSYTVAGWAGVALMVAAVVWLGWQGKWLGFAISLLFLLASTAFLLGRSRFPSLFDLLFVVAALANGAGWLWELYSQVMGYDEVVHAYTTFAGILSLGVALYYSARAHLRTVAFGLAVVTMGIAAGAIWEMFEWAIINIKDPVADLIVDSIGAILAGLFATWVLKVEAEEERRADRS